MVHNTTEITKNFEESKTKNCFSLLFFIFFSTKKYFMHKMPQLVGSKIVYGRDLDSLSTVKQQLMVTDSFNIFLYICQPTKVHICKMIEPCTTIERSTICQNNHIHLQKPLKTRAAPKKLRDQFIHIKLQDYVILLKILTFIEMMKYE